MTGRVPFQVPDSVVVDFDSTLVTRDRFYGQLRVHHTLFWDFDYEKLLLSSAFVCRCNDNWM